MKTIALTSWFTSVIIAVIASVSWSKAIPKADHLPLGVTGAGLEIFFTIGWGTVIAWSFIGDLFGRDPDKYKKQ